MQEVELSAGIIEYEDTGGSGPIVVLMHGLAMDGSLWRHVVCVAAFFPLSLPPWQRRPLPDRLRLQFPFQTRERWWQQHDWHDTSRTRKRNTPAANAVGWPGRFSPGTATSPVHV